MTENSKLLILAGVHGRQSGQLGSDEEGFLRDSQGQIDLLQRKKGEDIKAKNIKFEVKDVGQINTLSDSDTKARAFDEKKFVEAVESFKPCEIGKSELCSSHFVTKTREEILGFGQYHLLLEPPDHQT